MIEGLMLALTPAYLFWLTVGVLIGMVVGTLPGLTATISDGAPSQPLASIGATR